MDTVRVHLLPPAQEISDHQWIDAIESLQTQHHWDNYAHARIAEAENILGEISEIIDTLETPAGNTPTC